ncbi:vitamin K epoxide reductase family protein [uncultured Mobiluncus sp.]|uniref:vitamin K epoxide reductase family protein n=1 Tax=uncultured Mobiluncus sp. TaxID=293425 RepID=UPI00262F03BF|nr:vitamin K epoxide reductase family protein [uncultured Mobiluncus sp.]
MEQEPDDATAPDSSHSPSPAPMPAPDAPANPAASASATSLVNPANPNPQTLTEPGASEAIEDQANSGTLAESDSPRTPIEPPTSAEPNPTSLVAPEEPENPVDADTPDARATRPSIPTLVLLIVLAVVAMAASAELVLSEIQTLKQPTAHLGCDLNPLIGCSASLTTWQAHLLFGIPNALVGVGLFAGLAGVFLAWFGGRVPRWLVVLIEAGLTAALALIVFFLHQSIFEFTKLCPFCFIVWMCTIVLWVQLGAALMRLGWLFPDTGFARVWVAQRWLITAIILLLIVLVVAVTLSDKLVYLF